VAATGEARAAAVALAQGAYYAGTGVWPLLSMRSFERVTGPKRDHWLVKTVGVLVTTIGVTLIHAGRRGRVPPDVALLAALGAGALATIDVVYAGRRRISPVYLLDAVPEVLLASWWARRIASGGSASDGRDAA
jgi:hypothetical protein